MEEVRAGWFYGLSPRVRGNRTVSLRMPTSPWSIAKSCFRYWTLQYDPGRFSDIQRARNGQRWHGEYSYDFDRQAADVRELKGWGLKQVTIAAVVGLSPGRVSQILSQGL